MGCWRVAGAGEVDAHSDLRAARDRQVPDPQVDCGFMGQEVDESVGPLLVDRISRDRWFDACVVSCRDTRKEWTVSEVARDIQMNGVASLIVKPDQEASNLDSYHVFRKSLKVIAGVELVEAIFEESPVQANASCPVEKCVICEIQTETRSCDVCVVGARTRSRSW